MIFFSHLFKMKLAVFYFKIGSIFFFFFFFFFLYSQVFFNSIKKEKKMFTNFLSV